MIDVQMDGAGRRLLLEVIRERRHDFAKIVGWSLAQGVPAALSGLMVSTAVDRFVSGRPLSGNVALAFLGLLAACGTAASVRRFRPLSDLSNDVYEGFLAESVGGAIRSASTGGPRPDLSPMAGIITQVQSLRGIISALLMSIQHLLIAVCGSSIGLALLNLRLALVCVGCLALSFLLSALHLVATARYQRAVLDAEEEVASATGAVLAARRDLIAMGAEDRAVRETAEAFDREARKGVALARQEAARPVLALIAAQLPLILLLASAPALLDHDALTMGEIVGAATYLAATMEPAVRALYGVVGLWGLELLVHVDRLAKGFVTDLQMADRSELSRLNSTDVSVSDVTFRYRPDAAPVICRLNLSLPAGEHLAVVGPSGIGKSTLAALLAGLIRPDTGTIHIGEAAINDIGEADIRRIVGFLPQQAYVFSGTLRENLMYLAPSLEDEAILEVADLLGLDVLLAKLGGLDAQIGAGGAILSGGEMQLVALARVYLSEARIVILDEATSLMDPVAESRAEDAFKARPGTTLVIVAHRLSSARRADRILVLEGDRDQIGSHTDLMRTSAFYAAVAGYWASGHPS